MRPVRWAEVWSRLSQNLSDVVSIRKDKECLQIARAECRGRGISRSADKELPRAKVAGSDGATKLLALVQPAASTKYRAIKIVLTVVLYLRDP